jgi:antitoxin ParD1/3/4
MAARNVNLTDDLAAFVDEQVHSGRHQNAREVVREALRRYEGDLAAENARIVSIRTVIREGRDAIDRGGFSLIATPADSKALLSKLTHREGMADSGGG